MEVSWDVTGRCMLLDAFCAMGLLDKNEAGYGLNLMAKVYLLPGKPTYIGYSFLRDLAWEQRGNLAEAIRSGRRPVIETIQPPRRRPSGLVTWQDAGQHRTGAWRILKSCGRRWASRHGTGCASPQGMCCSRRAG